MKLFLLRHGKADWPAWDRPDDERPLTDEGVADLRRVGEALRCMRVLPEMIYTSPLARALQTAEIVAGILQAPLEQREELRPGFDKQKCGEILALRPEAEVMVVGHEPDFSRVICSLTGARVKVSKAGLALIEMGEGLPEPRLAWLMPAKVLIRLYR